MNRSARDVVHECARACATCPHALFLRDIKRISRTTLRGGLTPADCSWLICDGWNSSLLRRRDESEIHEVERGCAAGLCLHHYQSKIVTGAAKMRDPGVVASLYVNKKKPINLLLHNDRSPFKMLA